jgi:succinate dehydrogenase / fumarate reductase iron-sulfur subunit
MKLEFSVYRYNPDVDDAPRMQDYTLEAEEGRDMMLLDALIQLKEKDPSLSFRRSCREGVCGSDGLNMNGKNGLACITPISALNQPGKKIVIRPLPGLPVIRDLVVDMGQFYAQYEKIKPYLLNNGQNPPAREHLQCLSSVKNSMVCTSVFSAHVVRRLARRSGGTRTSSSARLVCWLRIAS